MALTFTGTSYHCNTADAQLIFYEMLVVVADTNVALRRPAFASSQASTTAGPEKAVDGDWTSTYYECNTPTYCWWYVDLVQSYFLADIEYITLFSLVPARSNCYQVCG